MYPSLSVRAHVYFSRARNRLVAVARMTPRMGSTFVPFRGPHARSAVGALSFLGLVMSVL
jgi:hypothetical protein